MLSKSTTILAFVHGIQAAETLIFDEEFATFNMSRWQHEISMSGGGNWEFEYYTNNRTNSWVDNGVLYLQPTFTVDTVGANTLASGILSLWGGAPADLCTSNAFWGCERNAAAGGNVLNPIQSARIRSVNSFGFTYGRTEISAKLPKGDWIWPAIWMLPTHNEYGAWPASGEIDIVESRGNPSSCTGGVNSFGSTLHYGPGWPLDAWDTAHADYTLPSGDLSDAFHTYGMEWSVDGIKTTIDGTTVLDHKFTTDQFTQGGFPKTMNNPWKYETEKSAPFNRDFYFVFNVAVGGTNSYFNDGWCNKPWTNTDGHSVTTFWNARSQWFPSWNYPATNDSAMKIQSVKVWQTTNSEENVEILQN